MHWTILDFISMYEKTVQPFFDSVAGDVANYYMTRADSLHTVLGLLHYQFDGNVDKVNYFINNVYNLLERQCRKKLYGSCISSEHRKKFLF